MVYPSLGLLVERGISMILFLICIMLVLYAKGVCRLD